MACIKKKKKTDENIVGVGCLTILYGYYAFWTVFPRVQRLKESHFLKNQFNFKVMPEISLKVLFFIFKMTGYDESCLNPICCWVSNLFFFFFACAV